MARRWRPLAGEPDPESGALHLHIGTNKRSIVADIARSEEDRQFVRRLVAGADIVIESFRPEPLDAWALGFEALWELNRRLVLTSITPFGQTGPYAHYHGEEIVYYAVLGHWRGGAGTGQARWQHHPVPVRQPGGHDQRRRAHEHEGRRVTIACTGTHRAEPFVEATGTFIEVDLTRIIGEFDRLVEEYFERRLLDPSLPTQSGERILARGGAAIATSHSPPATPPGAPLGPPDEARARRSAPVKRPMESKTSEDEAGGPRAHVRTPDSAAIVHAVGASEPILDPVSTRH